VVSALITVSEADKRIHDQHDEQAREAANQRQGLRSSLLAL
jgi:hypothetical protein